MAISAILIDQAARRFFFRQTRSGVPVQLPFDQVTIDTNDTYYEPVYGARITDKGVRQRGRVSDALYLPKLMSLPRPARPVTGEFGVWFYGGI